MGEAISKAAPAPTIADGFWPALPSLLWFLLAVIVLAYLRRELVAVLREVSWRLKIGAAVKVATFELGATYVDPGNLQDSAGAVQSRVDPADERYAQRRMYYEPNRHILLVHRIAPSKEPHQLYDILLYVVPHKGTDLLGLLSVEYYFGHHWGNRIFTSTDRARAFAVSTSAFGAFMATAKLNFTDGVSVFVNRYVDFEMGAASRRTT
jgi:hypothetical protein